jgi:MYXO-CTERM domain-containing protein
MGRKHIGAVAMAAVVVAGTAHADEVVQIQVDALLDARAVTTLTGGRLVTWTVGIDGNGNSDGYMTAAASKFHGDPPTLKTLPDDGKFPADARHPEVMLHFSNDAPATSQQTHYVRGAGRFSFSVPPAVYSKMFLFVTSSEGSSSLRVSLTYADTADTISITVPDYYVDVPANDPVVFNLATNLPKWNQQNNVAEANHHNLTGLEIHPVGKTLSGVTIEKTAPGYLVFWGATGIAIGLDADAGSDAAARDATVDVEVDVDAGSGGADAGAGGAAGSSGSGGGSGSGGLAGASGAAVGAGGAPGAGGAAGSDRPAANATDTGCACRASGARGSGLAALALLLAALVRRRVRGS